jgi:Family of unknown function (DUF5654)
MSDRTPQEPRPGPTDPAPPTTAETAAGDAGAAAARAELAAAEAEASREESFALAAAAREAAMEAAKRAGRFSREFFVTVISVVTTAFGVVVALAWNTALSNALQRFSGQDARTIALFIYALLITFLAVLAIVILSRLAKRIGASPVEFKLGEKKE